MFAGAPGVGRSAELAGPGSAAAAAPAQSGAMSASYQQAAAQRWAQWAASARTDDELVRVLAAAVREHGLGRVATAAVLTAARADPGWADNPIAAREVLRRKAARLRAQRRHVADARRRSQRHRAAVLALRYGRRRGRSGPRTDASTPQYGRRSAGSAAPMSGAPLDRTSSTAQGWSSGPTPRPGWACTAPPTSRSMTACQFPGPRFAPATWSFPMPDMCNWRSVRIWWSRRHTPGPRCASARWAPMSRSGGCCNRQRHGVASQPCRSRRRTR